MSSEINNRISNTWGKRKDRKKSVYQNKGILPHAKLMTLKTEVIETHCCIGVLRGRKMRTILELFTAFINIVDTDTWAVKEEGNGPAMTV